MKQDLYICRCGSLQHSFVVTVDKEDLFLEIHLTPLPFWKRLKNAVKYVMGQRSPYGDFEEIVLSPDMALDLGDKLIEWSQGESVVFTPNDVY
jgi:hypothetical protein